MEAERRYLRCYDYNVAKIINELARVVVSRGGMIRKPIYYTYVISNRSLMERKVELEEMLAKDLVDQSIRKVLKGEAKRLDEIKNEPLQVPFLNYLTFLLDGYYYYVQISHNPLFSTEYLKAEINRGRESYLDELESDWKDGGWKTDALLSNEYSEEMVIWAAETLLKQLQDVIPYYVPESENRGLKVKMEEYVNAL